MKISELLIEKENRTKFSQYMYHATVSPKIQSIFKNGLMPQKERNWNFSETPENVLFFADNPKTALYYGNIVSRNYYDNLGWRTKPYVVLLRTLTKNIKNITKGDDEYFTTSSIPSQNLEVFLHDKWQSLISAKNAISGIASGDWDEGSDEFEDEYGLEDE